MNTPIFDTLYAESDEVTRALVWDAVRPLDSAGVHDFINWVTVASRAFADVAAIASIEVSQ